MQNVLALLSVMAVSLSPMAVAQGVLGFGISSRQFILEDAGAILGAVYRWDSTAEASVVLRFEGVGATLGVDFKAADQTLVFAAGESSRYFGFNLIDDLEVEANETIRLTVSDPVNGELISSASVTLLDNDVGTLDGESQGDESTGLTFTLTRLNGLQHAATLTYRTRPVADPTTAATAGVDYVEATGTVTFQPGETMKTIRIETIDNQQMEPNLRRLMLEFESTSPFLRGESFQLEVTDDEPLSIRWARQLPQLPSRVSEGGVIRLEFARSGELAGDTWIRLRHRILLRPCDDSSWGSFELGTNGLPIGWQLVSEGTTEGFGPRDRTLSLELIAPDDPQLQTTNRCLTVILDTPDRPDAIKGWVVDLKLDDSESRIVTGSTGMIPGATEESSFVPLPDGSAYILGEVLSRIRPELDRDPQFQPEIPTQLAPTVIAPMPAGGVMVAAVNRRDQKWSLLSLDHRGRADAAFRLETPLQRVSAMKTTSDGFVYLSDGRRLMRLKPDGKPDPAFEEPEINGIIERIWLDGPIAYLGGRFTNFAGRSHTNLSLIRIQGNGTPDPDFLGQVGGDGRIILDLLPLELGRLLVLETDLYSNTLQVRGANGGVLTNYWAGKFEHLARLDNGRVFRASGSFWCGMAGCSCERSLLELRLEAMPEIDWIEVLPTRRWIDSYQFASQRIYAAGEYLWIREPGTSACRRLRYLKEGETAFGFVPASEAELASQGGRLVGAVRRFAHSSDREATTMVTLNVGRSDSATRFQPFELPVTFAAGEVTKPVLLPEGFRFTPDSLSEVRLTLAAPPGPPLGGTTAMTSLMVGVPDQSSSYRLAIHRWNDSYPGDPPLLSLTGPHGPFRVDACFYFGFAMNPQSWFTVYSDFTWSTIDGPVARLSPDAPAALLPVPTFLLGREAYFLRVVADP